MDTSGFAFPKPGDVGKTKVVKLSREAYRKHREKVWEKQGQACWYCKRPILLSSGELHHVHGRGMGGGKRNDLKTRMSCQACHRRKHNQ